MIINTLFYSFQLLDNMESKMKSTCVEGTIPKLFEGKMLVSNDLLTQVTYLMLFYMLDKKNIIISFGNYMITMVIIQSIIYHRICHKQEWYFSGFNRNSVFLTFSRTIFLVFLSIMKDFFSKIWFSSHFFSDQSHA